MKVDHECEEDHLCCCSMTALEPNEDCPVHAAGPYPPRCGICGKFIKRRESEANDAKFDRHLNEASKIVAKWPEWKRNLLMD